MAISPEIKPRVTVSAGSEYDMASSRSAAAESRKDRLESSSSNTVGYVMGVIALIVAGYFAYTYYYAPTTIVPATTTQSTAPVAPLVTPPVVPAPSATTPVTPPATTTTP